MTVNRWHTHPALRSSGDTIDAHQWRVALMCVKIADISGADLSTDLLIAARTHDEAERVLGDMPYPARQQFPALALAYASAEAEVLGQMGYAIVLSDGDASILRLADRMDAYEWSRDHGAPIGGAGEIARMAWAISPAVGAWVKGRL